MNWYTTLEEAKTRMKISGTSYDADVSLLIDEVSREIDKRCGRHFYVKQEARIFDVQEGRVSVDVDDLLSVSAVGLDTELDQTFTGETLTENTDYVLVPDNRWPKWTLEQLPLSTKWLTPGRRMIRITGLWGYGDGMRADPVDALGVTGTLTDAADTSLALSADGTVKVGMTLRLGAEQMFVSGLATLSATVVRGVNGTTATAQTAVAIYRYRVPSTLEKFCKTFCDVDWQSRAAAGIYQRRIGNYSEMFMTPGQAKTATERMLGLYKRRSFGKPVLSL